MATKNKDNLSEADLSYKEEIDNLITELLDTNLDDIQAKHILLKIIEHATSDAGKISSVPKALQFLIVHIAALDDLYKKYMAESGKDSYSLVLLLELVSFLDAVDIPNNLEPPGGIESPDLSDSFKLLLYKLEANIIAERMLASNSLSKDVRSGLLSRGVNFWGNEYLISLSTQIVRFFGLPSTRDVYSTLMNCDSTDCVMAPPGSSVTKGNEIPLTIMESLKMVEIMTDFWFQNGFEYDAVDLLLEVDRVESISKKCGDDFDLITRVTTYLLSIVSYAATPSESQRILTVSCDIFLNTDRSAEALRVAFKLNDLDRVQSIILSCKNSSVRKQLALMCASNGIHLNYTKVAIIDGCCVSTESELDELNALSSGECLSGFFLNLGAELEVLEPMHPAEIFKAYPITKNNFGLSSHLGQSAGGISIDSAKDNLAHTFVNAFVNCGFGTDKLINSDGSNWIFKHQDNGLLCAVASVGILNLWNINEGLSQIDKFQYSSDPFVKAGAFAAFGLASCGVVSESDPISGLLLDQLDTANPTERFGVILGLGFGYAGSCRESLLEVLIPCIIDDSPTNSLECSVFAAVSLGLIFVGSGNQEAAEAILQTLLEKETNGSNILGSPLSYMYICALGLLQLGRMDSCEPLLEALSALRHPFGKFASIAVESFAFVGSGDVLKIQKLLKFCVSNDNSQQNEDSGASNSSINDDSMDVDTPQAEDNKDKKRTAKSDFKSEGKYVEDAIVGTTESSMAILGIPLISLTESVGCAMIIRLLEHPLQCGSVYERRAVPLALALANVSNPNPQIVDILSKLTHDLDSDVSLHAIFALGIVGSGTNNSRISVLLQGIAKNHTRDPTFMFVIRLAVGLLYMGKGTTTISPLHSEGFLLNKVAIGGLLVVMMSALDMKNTIAGKMPYVMLHLALSIRPRWLITVTPGLEHVRIPVRVGNIVETTGTAGKPRRISGFQTHQTPVLIGANERAELASEEYTSCTPILEGIVIVEKSD